MTSDALPPTDDRGLVERLRRTLAETEPTQHGARIEAIADDLAARGIDARLVALLAAAPEPEMRRLTVRIATRLPDPPGPALFLVLRHLLRDQNVPERARLELAAFLLRA